MLSQNTAFVNGFKRILRQLHLLLLAKTVIKRTLLHIPTTIIIVHIYYARSPTRRKHPRVKTLSHLARLVRVMPPVIMMRGQQVILSLLHNYIVHQLLRAQVLLKLLFEGAVLRCHEMTRLRSASMQGQDLDVLLRAAPPGIAWLHVGSCCLMIRDRFGYLTSVVSGP